MLFPSLLGLAYDRIRSVFLYDFKGVRLAYLLAFTRGGSSIARAGSLYRLKKGRGGNFSFYYRLVRRLMGLVLDSGISASYELVRSGSIAISYRPFYGGSFLLIAA